MELRSLKYYLAVCHEGNMSRAAEKLHVTQPTLSRTIADLERELGCELLIRHSRSVEPTEDGLYLQRRARDLLAIAEQAKADLTGSHQVVEGDVRICAGESDAMRIVASAIKRFQDNYPQVCFHIQSGDAALAIERLERGLDDFALLLGYPHIDTYAHIRLNHVDAWGVYLREDDPLAQLDSIAPKDLARQPLLIPNQAFRLDMLSAWFGDLRDQAHICGTFTLGHNGTLMVREGMGCMLGLGNVQHTGKGTGLEFRPLSPAVEGRWDFAWLKHQPTSRAVQLFLEEMIRQAPKDQRQTESSL